MATTHQEDRVGDAVKWINEQRAKPEPARGHDIPRFSPAEARAQGKLVPTRPAPPPPQQASIEPEEELFELPLHGKPVASSLPQPAPSSGKGTADADNDFFDLPAHLLHGSNKSSPSRIPAFSSEEARAQGKVAPRRPAPPPPSASDHEASSRKIGGRSLATAPEKWRPSLATIKEEAEATRPQAALLSERYDGHRRELGAALKASHEIRRPKVSVFAGAKKTRAAAAEYRAQLQAHVHLLNGLIETSTPRSEDLQALTELKKGPEREHAVTAESWMFHIQRQHSEANSQIAAIKAKIAEIDKGLKR